ncbi:MAG TPA: signal peptidase I [Candidatus Aquabacterium excrementipullorum]|nr:signal peptidase I [Candidatus Aquabacterium excrementipullorum]
MKHWFKDNRNFLIFVIGFGFFRLAVADWNPIPSGSMRPSLLEGDVVLVNRLAYDFKLPLTDVSLLKTGEPERGDVVIFMSPKDGTRLIKRLVAVPGDTVAMRANVLYINGVAVDYRAPSVVSEPLGEGRQTTAVRSTELLPGRAHAVQFLPEVLARRDFGPTIVPADSYFFLGDNRDNSADSRFIGVVPRHLLVGRAHHVLASADIQGHWLPRFDRFGARIE